MERRRGGRSSDCHFLWPQGAQARMFVGALEQNAE
jgi:hypothetical protein